MGSSHISDKMYIVEIHNMANISKPRFPINNKTMTTERSSIYTDVVYSYLVYSFFSYELQLYLLDCVREHGRKTKSNVLLFSIFFFPAQLPLVVA